MKDIIPHRNISYITDISVYCCVNDDCLYVDMLMLKYILKLRIIYFVKLCLIASLCLIAFLPWQNAFAAQSRYIARYENVNSAKHVNVVRNINVGREGRITTRSNSSYGSNRYNLRRRPNITAYNATDNSRIIAPELQQIGLEQNKLQIRNINDALRPNILQPNIAQSNIERNNVTAKTELVIKPFEYYNDAPISIAPPPVPIISSKNNINAPKIDEIKTIQTKPTQAIIELPAQQIAKTGDVIDFGVQPLQMQQIKTIPPEIISPKVEVPAQEQVQKVEVQEIEVQEIEIREVTYNNAPKIVPNTTSPNIAKTQNITASPDNSEPNIPTPKVTEIEVPTINAPPSVKLTEPQPDEISAQTKNILQKLPNDIFPTERMERGNFDVNRTKMQQTTPDYGGIAQEIGASVAVRRQSFDVNYELDKAYNALIRGNTEIAVQIYRDVLNAEPNNKYALFGLATTYHKLGMTKQARPIYGRLLELDPYNKEALNNFLALVGEEAPESAILYLEQLKGQNSDFSPIYAQLASLYSKQNNNQLAIENMQEAILISPENLVYQYNLAVMYDKAKQGDRAAMLYRQLVKSGLDGKELPASLSDIQKRLTYLLSN